MFGSIGGMELLGVLVIALILFGPRRLPEIGRTLGKTMQQFRRAANDLRFDLEREVQIDEVRAIEKDLKTVSREIQGGLQPEPSAHLPQPEDSSSRTEPEASDKADGGNA